MSTSSRKRSRTEPSVDDGRAECPFTIMYVSPEDKSKGQKGKKRRKQSEPEEEDIAKVQNSPFTPSGKFKNDETLDLHYRVEPRDKWMGMTRYNSFVLNQAKYFSEGFIYVANDSTIAPKEPLQNGSGLRRQPDEWVARILEIRAADEHHVYARVYWMYWPEEIPVGTKDGNKYVSGRQPYHGHNELIASNHMDVINVVSVTQEAKVKQWFEENDEEVQDALYWRQAFDIRSMQLSSIQRTCKCDQPANPDKTLIACSDPKCSTWLHEECLKHDVLMRTYESLGRDKPYQKPVTENTENSVADSSDKAAGRPLSPPDNGSEVQQSIDAKMGNDSDNGITAEPSSQYPPTAGTAKNSRGEAVSVDKSITAASKTGRKPQGKKKKMDASSKPYEGLFEVALKLAESPSVVEIRDLRENVKGGEKTWTEPLACLVCGAMIS
ncbi:hypothetical protein SODALDRAFT_66696 [Sodiomyces alkalinus F11]|uniref:BAH domain-containing protein n=1 Tax=Sodiomyces alkalinus (strain CBS 110278 / VKM F-3762 / F11) TaxID=1314773 RepID=A0A3N2PLQ9_SODAK|nr:hypothetical protein SODALDRAFT_66696 [Sodiomyces alkalinus F11]ROT35457.1 hypothetical protein SODALDRAFT_66696 [Sodiomyces alkalinus F11]